MRKLAATELMSMDGVVESPNEWAFSYSDDEMAAENEAGMAASDALLLGRKTYEEFAAFWPEQPRGTTMVDYINGVRKYVVSTTLDEPLGWENSVLIGGEGETAVGAISALKSRPGKNITVTGSIELVGWLMREGLLDELRCVVCPVVRGSGRRLFEDERDRRELELVGSRSFGTGAVTLTYRPAGERGT